LILQPVALPLLPALSKSILLVASNSRQSLWRVAHLHRDNGHNLATATAIPLPASVGQIINVNYFLDGELQECTAFSAVAPSERPVCAARRSNTREWYCPQARIAGHLTFHPLGRFRPHCGFRSGRPAVWPVCYIPPAKSPARIDDLAGYLRPGARGMTMRQGKFLSRPRSVRCLRAGTLAFPRSRRRRRMLAVDAGYVRQFARLVPRVGP
jgi:hypothetical protein